MEKVPWGRFPYSSDGGARKCASDSFCLPELLSVLPKLPDHQPRTTTLTLTLSLRERGYGGVGRMTG